VREPLLESGVVEVDRLRLLEEPGLVLDSDVGARCGPVVGGAPLESARVEIDVELELSREHAPLSLRRHLMQHDDVARRRRSVLLDHGLGIARVAEQFLRRNGGWERRVNEPLLGLGVGGAHANFQCRAEAPWRSDDDGERALGALRARLTRNDAPRDDRGREMDAEDQMRLQRGDRFGIATSAQVYAVSAPCVELMPCCDPKAAGAARGRAFGSRRGGRDPIDAESQDSHAVHDLQLGVLFVLAGVVVERHLLRFARLRTGRRAIGRPRSLIRLEELGVARSHLRSQRRELVLPMISRARGSITRSSSSAWCSMRSFSTLAFAPNTTSVGGVASSSAG